MKSKDLIQSFFPQAEFEIGNKLFVDTNQGDGNNDMPING